MIIVLKTEASKVILQKNLEENRRNKHIIPYDFCVIFFFYKL